MYTVQSMAAVIARHNDVNRYTIVNVLGGAGTGKSVATSMLVKEMAERYKYGVYYMSLNDMAHIIKLAKRLKQRKDWVIVIDDAGYVRGYDRFDRNHTYSIMDELEELYRLIKSHVVLLIVTNATISNPVFKHSDFKLITSIQESQKDTLVKMLGHEHRDTINKFQKYYSKLVYPRITYTGGTTRKVLVDVMGKLNVMEVTRSIVK